MKILLFLSFLFVFVFNQADRWEKLGGTNVDNGEGSNGGIYSGVGAYPGPRLSPQYWIGSEQETTTTGIKALYLYGGEGCSDSASCTSSHESHTFGYLSDMWQYKIETLTWDLIKGDELIDEPYHHETSYRYFFHPNHRPFPRQGAALWKTGVDGLYSRFIMFGGHGYVDHRNVSIGSYKWSVEPYYGYFRDLWVFTTESQNQNTWGFLAGDFYENQYNAKQGISGENETIPGGRYGATTWKIGGDYYLFGGLGFGGQTGGGVSFLCDLWKWVLLEFTQAKKDEISAKWELFDTLPDHELNNYGGEYVKKFSDSASPGGRQSAVGWTMKDEKLGDLLYLFGGLHADKDVLQDVWVYSITKKQWKWVGAKYGRAVATARYKPHFFLDIPDYSDRYEGYVFVFGGYSYFGTDFTKNKYHNDMWGFHTGFNQWDQMSGDCCTITEGEATSGNYGTDDLKSHPCRRAGGASWTDGNEWYVFGGEGWTNKEYFENETKGIARLNDFWKYSFDSTNYYIEDLPENLGAIYIVLYVFLGLFGVVIVIVGIAITVYFIWFGIRKYQEYDPSEMEKSGTDTSGGSASDSSSGGEEKEML